MPAVVFAKVGFDRVGFVKVVFDRVVFDRSCSSGRFRQSRVRQVALVRSFSSETGSTGRVRQGCGGATNSGDFGSKSGGFRV